MLKEIKFALYSIKKNIQSSAELRTSFLMNVIGMALNNIAFIILWVFFVNSVGVIGGWTAIDIIGLQGFLALSYGIVYSTASGIRMLPDLVTSGAFDRIMLSPKNLLIRLSTSYFNASAVGDMLFGIICLIIYAILLNSGWWQILVIIYLVILITIAFLALNVVIYSTSFFFFDSDAVTNGIFELFFTPALFHGGAFQGVMRFIFTFIIPSLLIGALPVEATRNIGGSTLTLVTILTIFWSFVSLKIFKIAVKRYESSNFMTFGK